MNEKPCDFLGNEICAGDEVAFFALGYRMLTRGIIVKVTPKCVFIDYDNSWNYDHHEEHTRQEQKQVIDLTALNRRAQPANEPLTCDGCVNFGTNQFGCVGPDMCIGCARQPRKDLYRRPPERSENDGAK